MREEEEVREAREEPRPHAGVSCPLLSLLLLLLLLLGSLYHHRQPDPPSTPPYYVEHPSAPASYSSYAWEEQREGEEAAD